MFLPGSAHANVISPTLPSTGVSQHSKRGQPRGRHQHGAEASQGHSRHLAEAAQGHSRHLAARSAGGAAAGSEAGEVGGEREAGEVGGAN